MARAFNGRVRFITENYGESRIAARFGVRRYPVVFVNDVLVATPRDFGFLGSREGDAPGRYAPLRNAASHERFRADLTRVVSLMLAGRQDEASALAAPADTGEVGALPDLSFTDVDGRPGSTADVKGRVVVVTFWATWCPPCRAELAWLGQAKRRYGDRLVVVALAVESDEAEVRRVVASLGLPFRWGLRTPAMLRTFGDVSAIPTLLIFDKEGRSAGEYYGSTPALHQAASDRMEALIAKDGAR